ncbi:MAG: hypothetical protein ACTHJJ_13320 [Intrasporangium sp.]|uniref:hypothetical protein n=1 Tax=Intrasporangium sp. TaxID=1925024 RepID=UPI003F7FCE9C
MGRRLRRAGVLAAAIVLVPTAAMAAFQSSAGSPFAAATATVDTPADVSFSSTCASGQTAGTVRIKTFSQVALADGYLLQVSQAGQVVASQRVSGSSPVNLTFTRGGTFDLSVAATLKSWTGVPLTRSFTC